MVIKIRTVGDGRVAGAAPSGNAPLVISPVSLPLEKRSAGRPSKPGPKPWEAAGMSKSSFFRKKARDKNANG